jgi:hypothetical protein
MHPEILSTPGKTPNFVVRYSQRVHYWSHIRRTVRPAEHTTKFVPIFECCGTNKERQELPVQSLGKVPHSYRGVQDYNTV